MADKTVTSSIDFRHLFENVPTLLLILRPNAPVFTIATASNAYLAATLVKRDVIGRSLFEVFPDNPDNPNANGPANLRRSLERAIATRATDVMDVQRYDVQRPASEGGEFEERYWLPTNTPILNSAGEVDYIIHVAEDITEKVLAKKKGEQMFEELQEKSLLIKENDERINAILTGMLKYTVMDFSEELPISDKGDELDAIAMGLNTLISELRSYIEKLDASYQELAYVNLELDSFSYSVSHDLRAPLRAIDGYSRVILEDHGDKLDDDAKQCLDTIMRNAARMGALIDDLLSFSRLGKQNLTKVLLNMSSITDSVISELRQMTNGKAEIKVNQLRPVEGDSSMIRQVMTNLLSNAIKYSQKEEAPRVEVGCTPEADRVVYYVKDNGVGFDMKYYDKLFGVFQRLHGKNEFEGTGVGLALVQRIIKKHGGDVWGESVPGEGATFYFSLPLQSA